MHSSQLLYSKVSSVRLRSLLALELDQPEKMGRTDGFDGELTVVFEAVDCGAVEVQYLPSSRPLNPHTLH